MSIDEAVSAGVTVRELGSDGHQPFWVESTPDAQARLTLMTLRDRAAVEVSPAPSSVRSRVNEYGGGAWAARSTTVVWCDDTTGQVLARTGDQEPSAVSAPSERYRYGALELCPQLGIVIAVREEHSDFAITTTLVALPLPSPGAAPTSGLVIASGADFYADPAWNGDDLLAWIEWDQPAMPWDATRLVVAELTTADDSTAGSGLRVSSPLTVAGRIAAPREGVSVQHPHWAPDGSLVFTADASGWWTLYRWWPRSGQAPYRLSQQDGEEDQPMWQLGRQALAVSGGWVYHELRDQGVCWLARTPLAGGAVERIERFASVDAVVSAKDSVFALVGRADAPTAIVEVDDADRYGEAHIRVVRCPSLPPDPAITSIARPLTVTGRQGVVHSWYFAPHNDAVSAPEDELPPVILTVHGGPTGIATGSYDPEIAFWTSRGFAVVQVNYSGSAGFGRAYRERLRGQWGVAEVNDCIDVVDALIAEGLADPDRITIEGGSAGGFTVLACLTSSDRFAAGISRYGIGDLVALQTDTHKFEARYNDGLVGPWPTARALFEQRSPINHLDRLATPMLLFQGLDDRVVPPKQAEQMAQAVRARGLPVALVTFEGEGHGFRLPATRHRVLECELSFLGQLFGLAVPPGVDEVEVENL